MDARLYLRDEEGNVLTELEWVAAGTAGYWARARDHVYLGRDLIGTVDRSSGEAHVVSSARDHLGSQRAEVWTLEANTATDLWPYGSLSRTQSAGAAPALSNGAHLFTGHEREYTGSQTAADPLEGLDFMHARYYAPTLGRFLSVDPVGGEPGLSQSWNRYAYVRGNPVNATDPDGRELIGALIGAAGGAWKAAYENIRLASERPVSMRELLQNVVANVAGGAVTGATAGLGSGLIGSAVMGAAGSVVGGIVKRAVDPTLMNTKAITRDALQRDAIAGGLGGFAGAVGKNVYLLARRSAVQAAKLGAAVARAEAAEDPTLVAVAREAERQAGKLIRDVVEHANVTGAVAASGTAEATAGHLQEVREKVRSNPLPAAK